MIKIPKQRFFQRPERKSPKEERNKARALELAERIQEIEREIQEGKLRGQELTEALQEVRKLAEEIRNLYEEKYEKYECLKTLEGHKDWVYSVIESQDGKHIISGSADGTIKIWGEKEE